MTDEKYIVFKRDEFEAWCKAEVEAATTLAYPLPVSLSDAVVLRHQDLLAAPMLGLYRDMLTLLIKTKDQEVDPKELQKIADWMDQNAMEATETGWKLPD